MASLADDYAASVKNNFRSPFFGTALLSWLMLNWEALFYAFSGDSNWRDSQKMQLIEEEIRRDNLSDVLLSLFSGAVVTLSIPVIAFCVDRVKLYLAHKNLVYAQKLQQHLHNSSTDSPE